MKTIIIKPSNEFFAKFQNIFGIPLFSLADSITSAIARVFIFDIIKFDRLLSNNDPDYDCNKCTYKNRSGYSINKYITAKFGKEASEVVKYLLDCNFEKEFNYDRSGQAQEALS